eukprot:7845511-Pyramimonas_sp.AAC.1
MTGLAVHLCTEHDSYHVNRLDCTTFLARNREPTEKKKPVLVPESRYPSCSSMIEIGHVASATLNGYHELTWQILHIALSSYNEGAGCGAHAPSSVAPHTAAAKVWRK